MTLVRPVLRRGQPEPGAVPGGQPHRTAEEPLPEPQRQPPPLQQVVDLVGGAAEDVLGRVPVAAPGRVPHRAACWAASTAMSQPVLPPPTTSTLRPRNCAGSLYADACITRPRKPRDRPRPRLRRPVVPVGDHDGRVPLDPLVAAAGAARRHVPPAVADRGHRDHLGAEPDAVAQAEMLGIALEVGQELAVVRIVRPVVRHREVGELGQRPGRDQVGAGVDRAAVVPPVPGAADGRLPLVAVDREALLAQVLDGGEPAGAGTDHTDRVVPVGEVRGVVHRPASSQNARPRAQSGGSRSPRRPAGGRWPGGPDRTRPPRTGPPRCPGETNSPSRRCRGSVAGKVGPRRPRAPGHQAVGDRTPGAAARPLVEVAGRDQRTLHGGQRGLPAAPPGRGARPGRWPGASRRR